MRKIYLKPYIGIVFPRMNYALLDDTKITVTTDDTDEVDKEEAEIKCGRYGDLWEDPEIEFDDRPNSLW